jgi:hypothetical protein
MLEERAIARRIRAGGLALRIAMVVAAALTGASVASPPSFTNVTATAGVGVSHSTTGFSGSAWAGGGAVGDFNRDGRMDLFLISGGTGNRADYLFINNGNGTFSDRAEAWGLTTVHRGKSAAVGDIDNDGWLDLFVTSAGPIGTPSAGQHKLYRNNGNGTFTNIAASAGVAFADPSAESAWTGVFGDYDLDGDLDLFVGGYAGTASSTEQHLFRNNGNLTFTDVTRASGILNTPLPIAANAARFVDLDGDRWPELVVIADFKGSQYFGSACFKNNGDGTFTDMTIAAGLGKEQNGMAQAILDVDNDGLLDLYATSIDSAPVLTGNQLYRNQGNGTFSEIGHAASVYAGGYGWGAVGVDVNNDGWEDLVETNGDASPASAFYNIPSKLWVNNGDLTFAEVATESGLIFTQKGRAVMRLDYDADGDQDIVIVRNNGPVALFRNDLSDAADTHWLRILLNTHAAEGLAPDGIGAAVRVTAGGVERMRVMDCGASYLATSELSAHVGLGSATSVDGVTIEWPNGVVQSVGPLATNQTISIDYAPPPPSCPADLDADALVGASDLALVLGAWGTSAGDIDGDGLTASSDLAVLLGAWGRCP